MQRKRAHTTVCDFLFSIHKYRYFTIEVRTFRLCNKIIPLLFSLSVCIPVRTCTWYVLFVFYCFLTYQSLLQLRVLYRLAVMLDTRHATAWLASESPLSLFNEFKSCGDIQRLRCIALERFLINYFSLDSVNRFVSLGDSYTWTSSFFNIYTDLNIWYDSTDFWILVRNFLTGAHKTAAPIDNCSE